MENPRLYSLLLIVILVAFPGCSQKTHEDKNAEYLALRKQGDAKDDADDPVAALELYVKAKTLVPNDAGLHYRIATTAGKLKKAHVCLEAITNLIRLDPRAGVDTVIPSLRKD